MNTIDLKNILIHQIAGIDDKSFLAAIKNIIDLKTDSTLYLTNVEQEYKIEQGLKELNIGNYITNEQLEKDVDQWLEE
ncbi:MULTISPECIES: hypothetical protein [unclassified Lentimicrobium]|uniref:hypothetical protein n=1 Tax=unclassified Lentimicrobium TaxID=2677434 RepID=UPI001553E6AF|nr:MULTISPECIES: hypothetical protein [unclassified Lentimicrobium]NPD47032.1 hypothetical protein [Lentimicrobium sp. S6]NPD84853.1 hypothetical protein [Lentimicrobium sp. L6]